VVFLGDFTPIIIALIATLGPILALSFATRRLGKYGLGDTQLQVNESLKELTEIEKAKVLIWKEKYEEEVLSHAETSRKLELTQHDVDECQRQLRDCFSLNHKVLGDMDEN